MQIPFSDGFHPKQPNNRNNNKRKKNEPTGRKSDPTDCVTWWIQPTFPHQTSFFFFFFFPSDQSPRATATCGACWVAERAQPAREKEAERERVACIRVCVFPASKVNAKAKEEDDKTWGEGDQTFLLLLLFLVRKKKKKEKRDDQEGCAAAGTTRKGSNKRCGLTLVYQAFINCFLTLYRYDIALLNCVPIGRQRRDRDAIVGSDPGERIKGRDGGQNLYRKRRKKVEEKEKKTIVMSLTGQLGIRIAPRVQVHLSSYLFLQ